MGPLLDRIPDTIDFFEVAPENWIDVGGRLGEAFDAIARQVDLACHGLLLNLGGPDPLDVTFLEKLERFIDTYDVRLYGDHLTYCADAGQLYELLPMPYTEDAARYMAARIRRVQDRLGRRITVENASYYCAPGQKIPEVEFINLVLDQADCLLLLDINNLYVNSVNHGYDPVAFLKQLPGERIAYAHIAGHSGTVPEIIVDTHGAPVIDPVWQLLESAYAEFGVFPTLLERDENIPALAEVVAEVEHIAALQSRYSQPRSSAAVR
jgi:uncharacterized protein (UPF0276 family)